MWLSSLLTPFVQLLSVVAVGFAQGLYALDAADGSAEPPSTACSLIISASTPAYLDSAQIVNVLVQALLQ